MAKDKEGNIIVSEDIKIQLNNNLVNMEIEQVNEANDHVHKEEQNEDDEQVMRDVYVNKED